MIPKFRAWHKKEKSMFEVGDIHWQFNPLEIVSIGRGPGISSQDRLYSDDFILMQSTGIKDDNHKEIFEGDIIENKGIKGEVVWDDDYLQWTVNEIGTTSFLELYLWERTSEIIGNIHENPQLLEGGKA